MMAATDSPTAEIDNELVRVWTRVGLLLGVRFDVMDARLGAIHGQLNRLEIATARGFGRIEARLERLGPIETHLKRLGAVETRLGAVEVRLDAVDVRLDR